MNIAQNRRPKFTANVHVVTHCGTVCREHVNVVNVLGEPPIKYDNVKVITPARLCVLSLWCPLYPARNHDIYTKRCISLLIWIVVRNLLLCKWMRGFVVGVIICKSLLISNVLEGLL